MALRISTPSSLLLLIVSLAGCQSIPPGPPLTDAGEVDAPSYAALAAAHNERVSQLARLQSRGVVEIVWRDADGRRRFRQGDVDLYLDLPRRTALRVTKLGQVYMWLGSDDDRYWLFDLVDDPVLYTGLHDPPASAQQQMLHTVQPLALLDLIGLGRLAEFAEEDGGAEPPVTYDRALDAWVVQSWGGGGPVRMYFDRTTQLPRQVEALEPDGEVAYVSTIHMRRYRSVPVPGISAAALPRMATLVDIDAADDEGEVKLLLDSPTGRVDDPVFERVFDLDRLVQSLRPQRIEGDLSQ